MCERYWRSILFAFLKYISLLMILSGVGFIIAGRIASPWFYMGLLSWPLFIMLGCVNLKYIYMIGKEEKTTYHQSFR